MDGPILGDQCKRRLPIKSFPNFALIPKEPPLRGRPLGIISGPTFLMVKENLLTKNYGMDQNLIQKLWKRISGIMGTCLEALTNPNLPLRIR